MQRPDSRPKTYQIGSRWMRKGVEKEVSLKQTSVGSCNCGAKAENRCWLGAAAASGEDHHHQEEEEEEEKKEKEEKEDEVKKKEEEEEEEEEGDVKEEAKRLSRRRH